MSGLDMRLISSSVICWVLAQSPLYGQTLAPPSVGDASSADGLISSSEAKSKLPDSPDPDGVKEMSEEEIFQKMFGKSAPDVGPSRYVVLLDGMNTGEAFIDPAEDGSIDTEFLRTVVLPFLLPEPAEALSQVLTGPKVSFSSLRSLSYTVSFDRRALVLVMEIPFDLRSERTVLLSGPSNRNLVDVIEQADISGYLSARAGMDLVQQSNNTDTGFSGFAATIDGAVNIHGVVLEGRMRYDDNARRSFTRADVRLVYDDIANLVRYEAGDLTVRGRNYQTSPKIAGIAAYREFRIDPYNDPRPTGERGIVLERPARVEIFVNGANARTINLGAGRYSIRDFPIIPGAANDVEFKITYATGEIEYVSFPAFANIDLLEQGTTEFAVNAGVPYTDEDGFRRYDTGNFNLMGFARKGLTSTLTAGVNIEASKDIALVGGEVSWASPIGSFDLNFSDDLTNPGPDSGRISLQYAWRTSDGTSGSSLDGILILTGKDYRTLDRLFDGTVSTVFAQGRYSRNLFGDVRVQLSGTYEKVIDPLPRERWSIGGSASKRIGPMTVAGSLDYMDDGFNRGISGQLSLFIPFGRGVLSSSYQTRDNVAKVEYQRSSASAVGSFGYGAGFERRDGGDRQFARVNYVGNRFEASAGQTRISNRNGDDIRAGFTLGSAIVMADGKFSISRPVTNSFAIIENASEIKTRLAIEPRSSFGSDKYLYSSYTDFMGAGVIPDLPAYFVRQIEIDAVDAPAGSGVGDEIFNIQPHYKSGYHLKVGVGGGTVSAVGILSDRNGQPLSLVSGTISKNGVENAPVDGGLIFTNSAGRFFMEGLEPGASYEGLVEVEGNAVRFSINVPEDALGIWRMPDATVLDVEISDEE